MMRVGGLMCVSIVIASAAPVQAAALTAEQTNQVAALTYQAAAAEASFKRQANAALTAQRGEIEAKVAELGAVRAKAAQSAKDAKTLAASVSRLQREIATAKLAFTAQLAEKDSAFATERAVLLAAGEKLAATPEGLEALTLFNAGGQENWAKAKLVLAQIEATREAKRRADAASDKRAAAELYEQARDRGYETLASVVEKREAVVAADPSASSDWRVLAELYLAAGRSDDALRAVLQAKSTAATDRQRSNAEGDLANVLSARGELVPARAAYETAVALARKLAAADPASTKNQLNLSSTLDDFGRFLRNRGEYEAALAFNSEALTIMRKLVATDPQSTFYKRELQVTLVRRSGIFNLLRRGSDQIAARAEAVALARDVLAADPASLASKRSLASNLGVMGLLLLGEDKTAEAEPLFTEQITLVRQALSAAPGEAALQSDLANALHYQGLLAQQRDQLSTALQSFREEMAIRRKFPGQRGLVLTLGSLGEILQKTGDTAGARTHYEEMLVAARVEAAKINAALSDRRNVVDAMEHLADLGALPGGWPEVAKAVESLAGKGGLAAEDAEWLAKIKTKQTGAAAAGAAKP